MKKSLLYISLLFSYILSFSQNDSLINTNQHLFEVDLEHLMKIPIISVSKKAESHFDSPLSASVITENIIKNSGATTIEELFRLVPGLIVREQTNGNFDVHIRGNDNIPPGNYIFNSMNSFSLVMIDGRKVYNQLNGGTFWETLPISLTDIQQIEIIRGPAAALYGANAVSGVINIITKKIENEKLNTNASIQYGTLNSLITNISLSSQITPKLGIRLSGNYDNRNRFEDTYYNYLFDKYTKTDSLSDWQANSNGFMSADKVKERYPQPNFSKQKMGTNLYAHYDFSEKSFIDATFSSQKSSAQSIFMETTLTPLCFRESTTHSVNVRSKIHQLLGQSSILKGTHDIFKGSYSPYKYDFHTFDANIEYDFINKNKKLSFRPGVNYQHTQYSDIKYTQNSKMGFGILNAEQILSTIGLTARFDYQPIVNTRFIGAIRADKYNHPEDIYVTYQFAITHKINENLLLRVVSSRANRGSFMIDIYTNLYADDILYKGNPNIKLPMMNLFEIGSRNKITDFLQTDIEFFYTHTKNFGGLEFDNFDIETNITTLRYRNYPTISKQIGTTLSLIITPSKTILLNIFGTIQKTKLENFEQDEYDFTYVPLGGNPIPSSDTINSIIHKNTPSFYGGMNISYQATNKLMIFSSLYTYSSQQYVYQGIPTQNGNTFNPTDNISAKARVDMKISYKIWKNNALFINGKNLLNSQKNEFGFAEKIGALYLIGLDISF